MMKNFFFISTIISSTIFALPEDEHSTSSSSSMIVQKKSHDDANASDDFVTGEDLENNPKAKNKKRNHFKKNEKKLPHTVHIEGEKKTFRDLDNEPKVYRKDHKKMISEVLAPELPDQIEEINKKAKTSSDLYSNINDQKYIF